MPGHTDDEREGALLRRFKAAGHGARPAGFGFVTRAEESAKHRPLLVVARVAQGPNLAAEARALAEAGADGIEIVVRGGTDSIKEAIAAVEIPCGAYLARGVDAAPAVEGLDWIHMGLEAPARLLAVEKLTRLVSVPPSLPPGRLGGLGALKAEVIVVDGSADGVLTIEALLSLRTIEATTKQPLLISSSLGLAPGDVTVLHEHGVEGVLVEGGAAEVRAYVAAMEELAEQQ